MAFHIIRNDITKVTADVIVNTANPEPVYAAGTDAAIYEAAGADRLLVEREKIGIIERGEVAVTPAFDLHARYIIHTVGPIWQDGRHGELETLKSCYEKSLQKAVELSCESIAFPLLATGVYGFPKDKALKIAIDTISSFLLEHDLEVTLVVFDQDSFVLSSRLFQSIDEYIDNHYIDEQLISEYGSPMCLGSVAQAETRKARKPRWPGGRRRRGFFTDALMESYRKEEEEVEEQELSSETEEAEDHAILMSPAISLDELLAHADLSFQQLLLSYVDRSGRKDADVYRRAGVSRQVFSNIRSSEDYVPKKKTILALAFALELNLDQAQDLLKRAGYTLSNSSRFDLICRYCFEHEIWNPMEVDAILFKYDQPTLADA